MHRFFTMVRILRGQMNRILVAYNLFGYGTRWTKIDIGGGPVHIDGYCNLDLSPTADIRLDLSRDSLPFKPNSIDTAICISAINYLPREQGARIIRETYRVLKPGGIARFATQDLYAIAKRYVNRDQAFFFQKLSNGTERFHGETMADKINSWFYGYQTTGGNRCSYMYDFETLALLFRKAGFSRIEEKAYQESDIPHIAEIDNRPDQLFFLEAKK